MREGLAKAGRANVAIGQPQGMIQRVCPSLTPEYTNCLPLQSTVSPLLRRVNSEQINRGIIFANFSINARQLTIFWQPAVRRYGEMA